MRPHIRPDQTIGGLARRLAAAADIDAPTSRTDLLATLTASVPGAFASTSSVWSDGRIRPHRHTTDSVIGTLTDHAQVRARSGPALDAIRTGAPVWSGHLWADDRWPDLHHDGALPAPGGGALCIPLMTRNERAPVVVSVYADAGALTATAVELVLAGVGDLRLALDVIALHEGIQDLQAAVRSNRSIGAAVGIVMAQHLLPYDDAVDLLKRASNRANTRLADLAEEITLTGALPAVLRTGPSPPGPRLRTEP